MDRIVFVVLFLAGLGASPDMAVAAARDIAVSVDAKGFTPSTISATKGETLKLIITRKVENTCVKKIVIPEFGINQDLPLNKPVTVSITTVKSGDVGFACPLDMVKGKIQVK